ncbi:type II toxin-antitoxin system RelE family toxin [Nocardiopsis nanhaiensis]
MKWEFDFRRVRKQIRSLPKEDAMDILRALTPLGEDPRRSDSNIKALSGYTDRYRLRVRSYRVIYDVIDDQIIIRLVAVGHRREIYRHLDR